LRTDGCKALLTSLIETNLINSITHISLNGNELNGVELINSLITIFSEIKNENNDKLKLDLSCNNFGEDGCELIKEKLNKFVDLCIE
jgi:hypothetical protein